ncbi:DUF1127 domain-containing protein [Defluviimonas sp. SAOS-178_SWC]|uniref:DUF1127 domain-containing protein n=1 Tax=Defluviimonas sp. SAOS-178_SWC TaxID=3121287 RepID=UPI0032215912
MAETTLHMPLKSTGIARAILKKVAAWREARRLDWELQVAARRLADLSPHLLADIGLTDASEARR